MVNLGGLIWVDSQTFFLRRKEKRLALFPSPRGTHRLLMCVKISISFFLMGSCGVESLSMMGGSSLDRRSPNWASSVRASLCVYREEYRKEGGGKEWREVRGPRKEADTHCSFWH
jgi:hypothetical protein